MWCSNEVFKKWREMRCNLAKYLESIYYISWKYTPSENQKNISEIGIRKLEDSLTGSALGNVYMFTIGNAGFCSHHMRSSVEYIGPKMFKKRKKKTIWKFVHSWYFHFHIKWKYLILMKSYLVRLLLLYSLHSFWI